MRMGHVRLSFGALGLGLLLGQACEGGGGACASCCEEYIEVINACKEQAGLAADGDPAACSNGDIDVKSKAVYDCQIAVYEGSSCASEQAWLDALQSALDCQ